MNASLKYSIILVMVLVASCIEKKRSASGGEIIAVPERVEVYNPSTGDSNTLLLKRNKKRYKIYTLINASCSSCIFELEKWTEFQSMIPNVNEVSIIPVCFSHDNFELLKFAFENNKVKKISLPLVLDTGENGFKQMNEKFVKKYGNFTVLADTDNHVLLQGNPMENLNDKAKFLSRLQKAE
jgi:hypothetical protein